MAFAFAGCGDDDTGPPGLPEAPTIVPTEAAETSAASPPAPSPTPTPTEATPPPPGSVRVALELVTDGFERPTYVTHAGDGSGRLFVPEKEGRIRVVIEGQVAGGPFLDISDLVTAQGGEQGLLGLAFHPDYPDEPRFYVYYTANDGGEHAGRALPGLERTRPWPIAGSARSLSRHPGQPPNHNGGMLAFGPDGYLYVGTGDGGGGGDPDGNGQNTGVLLGKILRIDVDGRRALRHPAGQPVRRPRRGVGRRSGRTGCATRGGSASTARPATCGSATSAQDSGEEINVQPAGSGGGVNYGWTIMEGDALLRSAERLRRPACAAGLRVRAREGCSVTGGMSTAAALPDLRGSTSSRTTARGRWSLVWAGRVPARIDGDGRGW